MQRELRVPSFILRSWTQLFLFNFTSIPKAEDSKATVFLE
jgi:hypothetical protein